MNERNTSSFTIAQDLVSQIGKSALMLIPAIRKWRLRRPRTSLDINDTNGYLRDKAFLGLNLLLEHSTEPRGKSICEIGAGDFLTSGLSMLVAGASRYAVVDRFPGNYSGETAKEMYKVVQDNWQKYFPQFTWDNSLQSVDFPEEYGDRIQLFGMGIEDVATSERFDVVCSFQVGEHITDIQAFADVHRRLLKPGGVGLHRVDFGPHDVWSNYKDPMTFLRFPETLWKLTGANRGIPNRRRHFEFLDAFEKAGLKTEVLFTEPFDDRHVDYDKLHRRFREMPKESLMVKTAVYRLAI